MKRWGDGGSLLLTHFNNAGCSQCLSIFAVLHIGLTGAAAAAAEVILRSDRSHVFHNTRYAPILLCAFACVSVYLSVRLGLPNVDLCSVAIELIGRVRV